MSVLSCWLVSVIRNTPVRVPGMVNATWLPSSHAFKTLEAPWKYTHSYSQRYCDLLGDVTHFSGSVGVTVEYYFTIYQIDPENKDMPIWRKKKEKETLNSEEQELILLWTHIFEADNKRTSVFRWITQMLTEPEACCPLRHGTKHSSPGNPASSSSAFSIYGCLHNGFTGFNLTH